MNSFPLTGIKIVVNDLIPKTEEPNKKHKRNAWDKYGSCHRRIQKKWNKRHGVTLMDHVIFANGVAYVTQNTFNLLRESHK